MDYDKSKQIIEATGNIKIENLKQTISIVSDKLKYLKNLEKILISENVQIEFEDKFIFNTDKAVYDKLKKQILVDNDFEINDKFGNKIKSKNSIYLLDEKILKINSVEMIDELRNKYFFENALVNLKNNELIADGIKIDFFKESFGNNENDPRLRGNYLYSDNYITLIKKEFLQLVKKTMMTVHLGSSKLKR